MTCKSKSAIEFIYLLRTREHTNTKEFVYKIGRTESSIEVRMNGYPKKSRLLHVHWVTDCVNAEKKLLALFNLKFIQRSDLGHEYFEGDVNEMIEVIDHYINKEYKFEKINMKLLMNQIINRSYVDPCNATDNIIYERYIHNITRCMNHICIGLDLDLSDQHVSKFMLDCSEAIEKNLEHFMLSNDINVLRLFKAFVNFCTNERMIPIIYEHIDKNPVANIHDLLKNKNLLELYVSYLKKEISYESLSDIMLLKNEIMVTLTDNVRSVIDIAHISDNTDENKIIVCQIDECETISNTINKPIETVSDNLIKINDNTSMLENIDKLRLEFVIATDESVIVALINKIKLIDNTLIQNHIVDKIRLQLILATDDVTINDLYKKIKLIDNKPLCYNVYDNIQYHYDPIKPTVKQSILNQVVPNQVVPNQVVPNQVVPNQVVSNQFNPNQFNPNQFNPYQFNPNQFNPYQFNPNQFNPYQFNPNQFNPYQFNPNQFNPNQFNPNQFNPNQFHPNQLNPNQFNPNQFNPNQFNPNQFNPNQFNPNQFNPNQFNPNQFNPNQFNHQPSYQNNPNNQFHPNCQPHPYQLVQSPKNNIKVEI